MENTFKKSVCKHKDAPAHFQPWVVVIHKLVINSHFNLSKITIKCRGIGYGYTDNSISWLKMVRLVKWTVLNLSHTGLEMGWWSGHYGKICTPQQVGQWLLAVARWNLCQRALEPHTSLWLLWLIVWIVSQQKSFQFCNCLKFIKVWRVVFANKLVSSMQTTGSHCSLLVSKAIPGRFSLREYTTSKLQEPHTSQSGKTSCSLLSSLTLVNLNC